MPDGELRRPPQLWEQRLSRLTSVLSVGLSSSGATSIVEPTPAPGAGGGTEPAPVLPSPGEFIAPSTPTLIGSVQGINVVWDGLNSSGDLWPSDTSYIEVHMSTSGPTFTPSSATLKGRLARPGGLSVVGLNRSSTYYFRFRGADPAGNVTDPSTAASGSPGQISAPDIAANAITANSIVAGTITGWQINASYLSGGTVSGGYITGGTISGGYITGGTVNGGYITGGTVSGSRIQTATSGRRIVLGAVGETYAAKFTNTSNNSIDLAIGADETNLYVTSTISGGKFICVPNAEFQNDLDATDNVYLGTSGANRALRVDLSGNVYSYGIDGATTANAANVRVGASAQLLKSTSTQRVKANIKSLGGELVGVDESKISDDPASVNPHDVLEVVASEFQSLTAADGDQRILGFIAENVAEAFPWAAEWDEEGLPSSVADRPILAALLQVVKEQQATITALTARIEALEA